MFVSMSSPWPSRGDRERGLGVRGGGQSEVQGSGCGHCPGASESRGPLRGVRAAEGPGAWEGR